MSSNFLEMLEQEVQQAANEVPDENTLANIAQLADRQLKLEAMQVRLSEIQEKVSDAHKDVSERLLPNALASAGVSEFKLTDGSVVSVKKGYFPSIEEENKPEAYSWMLENGHDIIKNEVSIKFSKGQSASAVEVADAIRELGFDPEQKESIHWQTFRAWAKEVMEKGLDVPDFIKIHTKDQTTIDRPKVKVKKEKK